LVSEKLKLSESFAGVTFLSFANGAPDLVAAFAAGGIEDGLSLEIGALYGAGFFVTSVVFAICIKAAKEITVAP